MALPTQIEFEKLPLKRLFVFSFLISVITILLGIGAHLFLPPEIPLYYGLPQTVEQLAPSLLIILPSLISIVLTITNAIFAIKTHSNYLKKILAFTSISISILASLTTYKILFLVGSF